APAHSAVVSLSRGAVATSGATDCWWHRDGKRVHHLLDPRTARPARVWIDPTDDDDGEEAGALIATATAFAPTAAQAEAAAKVALLRGYPTALRLVEAAWTKERVGNSGSAAMAAGVCGGFNDTNVALLLILGSGEVVCSLQLPRYLATLGGGGELWLD